MHIALVAPLISKSATGLSSYIVDLVPRLCDAGHRVTVVGTDCGYRGAGEQELIEVDPRALFTVFSVNGKINRRLYRSAELRQWFECHVRDFDVVDIQGIWSFVATEVAECCHRAEVGYVLTPHGMMTGWDWQKQLVMKRIFFATKLRTAWSHAAAVRYLSAGELAHSMIGPISPYVIIPNAIEAPATLGNTDEFAVRARFGLTGDGPIILFVGRVTDQKGVLELLHASQLFQRDCPRAQVVIAGPLEGAYGESVKQYAKAYRCGNVKLLGPVFGEAKYDLLSISSLFVTLSKNEGLSIAALEALSMGVPVVLTRESNLPEAEAGGAGVTTKCDPVVAAKDIADLLLNASRLESMRRNARSVAAYHFSWRAVLPRLLSLYAQVASGTVPREYPAAVAGERP